MGANVTVLHEFGKDPGADEMGNKLHDADALWTIGDSSQNAKAIFDRTGFGLALKESRGKVISGGSAGPHLDYIERGDGLVLPRRYYFKPFLIDEGFTGDNPVLGIDDAAALAF